MAVSSFNSAAGAAGAPTPLSRVDTITSSQTWTHPDGFDEPRLVRILLSGGGGGGGGGALRGSVYNDDFAGGGGGGGGGFMREVEFFVSGPLSLTIGAAGNGAAATSFSANNFSNNSRIGTNGLSGNSGGLTSVSDPSFGWSMSASGGGGGSAGNSSQNIFGPAGPVQGGTQGFGFTGQQPSAGSGGSGGSPGGGRNAGQVSNFQFSGRIGQRSGRIRADSYGGPNQYYNFTNESEAIDPHLAKYLSGGGAGGSTASRNFQSGSIANGGTGFFGNGGDSGSVYGPTANSGNGLSAGGGGGGGRFFSGNGTYSAQGGAAGTPGIAIIYY